MVDVKVKMILGVCAIASVLVIAKLSSSDSNQAMEIQPVSQEDVVYPAVQAASVSHTDTSYTTVESTVVEESSSQ
jgi:hypothetical protein